MPKIQEIDHQVRFESGDRIYISERPITFPINNENTLLLTFPKTITVKFCIIRTYNIFNKEDDRIIIIDTDGYFWHQYKYFVKDTPIKKRNIITIHK